MICLIVCISDTSCLYAFACVLSFALLCFALGFATPSAPPCGPPWEEVSRPCMAVVLFVMRLRLGAGVASTTVLVAIISERFDIVLVLQALEPLVASLALFEPFPFLEAPDLLVVQELAQERAYLVWFVEPPS